MSMERCVICVCVTVLLSVALPAEAKLNSVDSTFGPGTITRDDASGIDWLDLTVTSGQSINQILPQLAPGQKFAGFHFANDEELAGLFRDAGFATSSGQNSSNPNDVALATSLVSLLGQNISFPIGGETFSGSEGFLLQSGLLPGPDPNALVYQVGTIGVRVPCSSQSAPACASWHPLPELILPQGVSHDAAGASFLVRNVPSIPEPTSLFFGAVGLVLLGSL